MNLALLAQADAVCNAVLNSLADEQGDVIVQSPPGAGKTRLLEDATGHAALLLQRRVIIACPSNDQADDAARRIARAFPQLDVDRFVATDARPPALLGELPNLRIVTSTKRLAAPVTVATVAKYTEVEELGREADYLYVDEAFQVRRAEYERIRSLVRKAMLIGDPGQIRPIVKTSIRHFAADLGGPHTAAPQGLLATNTTRSFGLPVSRRLPQDTVEIVQPAFYSGLPFHGLAAAGQRRLQSRLPATTSTDVLLDRCLAAGSLSMIALPAAVRPVVDPHVIDLAGELIQRLLRRRCRTIEDDGERDLAAHHVGAVVFHREQVSALRKALGLSLRNVHVETANRFQGLERKIIIALHPLSGRIRASEFATEAGRMCVAVSRHRIACILIGRDGVREMLRHLACDDPLFLGQMDDPLFEGWRTHAAFWAALEERNLIIRP